jgi:bacteriophage N4 adsorption protein B
MPLWNPPAASALHPRNNTDSLICLGNAGGVNGGMIETGSGVFAALQWLLAFERELLAFAAFWFCVGLADEVGLDLSWLWLKLTGRARTRRLRPGYGQGRLTGPAAVLIPAFQESAVIATTVAHMLEVWPQANLRIYVGCYGNDAATLAAASAGAGDDPRVRLVIHGAHGPTTKADCLNRLYAALSADEARSGARFASVLLHDAEDMVHPAALEAIDAELTRHDFVQLPVRPELQATSRWIGGHYADEFAESHAKAMVVRDALGAALPAAGVGCGLSRAALARLAQNRKADGQTGPFSPEALTEDYELGWSCRARSGAAAFCACAMPMARWWRPAATFPASSLRQCGRRPAGSTGSPSRAGSGWAGARVRSSCGWRCAIGAGR